MPIIGVKMYVFPILGIIGGALYSCYNYFHVILNGGVGKNGSTVAVSLEIDESSERYRASNILNINAYV